MTPLYMPIEHVNSKVVPFDWAGKVKTVSPVVGKIFIKLREGITKARAQERVLLVTRCNSMVWSAGAIMLLGE